MCIVILALAFFSRSTSPTIASVEKFARDIVLFSDSSVANSFWNIANPSHEDRYIEQMPPKFFTVLQGGEVDADALQQSDRRYEQQLSFSSPRFATPKSSARAPSRLYKIFFQNVGRLTRIV